MKYLVRFFTPTYVIETDHRNMVEEIAYSLLHEAYHDIDTVEPYDGDRDADNYVSADNANDEER